MTESTDRELDVAFEEAAGMLVDKKASGKTWADFMASLLADVETAQRRLGLAARLHKAIAADGGQLPLVPDAFVERNPRAKRRVMMRAAQGAIVFSCPKCDASSPVPEGITTAARNRGIPCPKCNATEVLHATE
jgi:hypothetical protein